MSRGLRGRWYVTGCFLTFLYVMPQHVPAHKPNKPTHEKKHEVRQYYVSATGKDSNNGLSPRRPWATIQHAVDEFKLGEDGAIIHVAPGSYRSVTTECERWGFGPVAVCLNRGGLTPSIRLVIQCDVKWKCLIRTNTRGFVVIIANNVDIVGFDIGNAPDGGSGVSTVYTGKDLQSDGANSIHVINNYVHDLAQNVRGYHLGCPSEGAIEGQNQHGHYVTDFQVIGNFINNYGIKKPACHTAHGIYADTTGAVIENNIVANVPGAGILVSSAPCDSIVANNTSFDNGVAGFLFNNYKDPMCVLAGNNTIINNISVNNGHAGFYEETVGTDCSPLKPTRYANNLTYGNKHDYYNLGSCDLMETPFDEAPATTFVNYRGDGSGDYHLKAGSIAIGHGTTRCVPGQTECVPKLDFDGASRPQGSGIDIGAYEHR